MLESLSEYAEQSRHELWDSASWETFSSQVPPLEA